MGQFNTAGGCCYLLLLLLLLQNTVDAAYYSFYQILYWKPGGDTKNGSCWWPSVGCYSNEWTTSEAKSRICTTSFLELIFCRVFWVWGTLGHVAPTCYDCVNILVWGVELNRWQLVSFEKHQSPNLFPFLTSPPGEQKRWIVVRIRPNLYKKWWIREQIMKRYLSIAVHYCVLISLSLGHICLWWANSKTCSL